MRTNRITSFRDVHVIRGHGQRWTVAQEGQIATAANYRLRSHAVAFARAFAFAAHADVIVHELAGHSTRYTRTSLGYPTLLD